MAKRPKRRFISAKCCEISILQPQRARSHSEQSRQAIGYNGPQYHNALAVMSEIAHPTTIWHPEKLACNSKQERQPNNNKTEAHSNLSWPIWISVDLSNLCGESRDRSTFLIFAKGWYLDISWVENRYDWARSFCSGRLIQPNLTALAQVDNWSRGKSINHSSRKSELSFGFSSLNKSRYGSLVLLNSNPSVWKALYMLGSTGVCLKLRYIGCSGTIYPHHNAVVPGK
jgi:hypothetical protein